MGNHIITLLIILLNLGTLLVSLACPPRTNPTPPTKPSTHPPNVKRPYHPKSPVIEPPPTVPKQTPNVVPKPPIVPKPPVACPPPPPKTPYPPPPPSRGTCPIDTLKLSACVDILGGLITVGIGQSAKEECCPVLDGLLGLDAAVCLCTAIKAKLNSQYQHSHSHCSGSSCRLWQKSTCWIPLP